VGLAISFTVMSVLGYFFPPPGLGLQEPFIVEELGSGSSDVDVDVDEEKLSVSSTEKKGIAKTAEVKDV
jgi:hypothetical protein